MNQNSLNDNIKKNNQYIKRNYNQQIDNWYNGLREISLNDIIKFDKKYFNCKNKLTDEKINQIKLKYLNNLTIYIIQNMKIYVKNKQNDIMYKFNTGMDKILYNILEIKENLEEKLYNKTFKKSA